MLDGLKYLTNVLNPKLEDEPDHRERIDALLSTINTEIKFIQENKADQPPALLMEILGEDNILDIDCGGLERIC